MRRAVLTGIGMVTGFGDGWQVCWRNVLAGRSAVRQLDSVASSDLATQWGAPVTAFAPERYVNRRLLRQCTRNDRLAAVGAMLAVRDAAVDLDAVDRQRIGIVLSGGKEISDPEHLIAGSLAARDANSTADYRAFGAAASSVIHPLYYVEGLQSTALFTLSKLTGATGANGYFHGTAEASALAVARAANLVRTGEADLVLAGGADDRTSWWPLSQWDGLGVLSGRNDFGSTACRPFDLMRSGAAPGEGAVVLVLESAESAAARGAHVYAEIAGAATTFDPTGHLGSDRAGRPIAEAMIRAMGQAGEPCREVGVIVAHGNATRRGDLGEARGIRLAVGDSAAPALTCVKGATGELGASSGALNIAIAALTIDAGLVPSVTNLRQVDPILPAGGWIREYPVVGRVRTAIALASGLAGQRTAVVLRRPARQDRSGAGDE
ncbi:beta-ketoacyl-[acyl-carrier-protein] synthase family protein [Solihabitans fulvus]|uniref:Beta-ketoacyl-[acyl-carrier-protein] synthase family protein n=1 Tax=Solihabitans fulvus TaxID=1892852 RepID=A0A5B2XGU9_9PSEU|nr:beta-ketoacyl synthase N-terminal-like domain-containing protein [Solihabitans fulvus]KAA2262623.1 beta-ketoacyl-[acyl-carrier-protein] synthase family protein [Solihabitans fulvus]